MYVDLYPALLLSEPEEVEGGGAYLDVSVYEDQAFELFHHTAEHVSHLEAGEMIELAYWQDAEGNHNWAIARRNEGTEVESTELLRHEQLASASIARIYDHLIERGLPEDKAQTFASTVFINASG